jgi:hypothetical protein
MMSPSLHPHALLIDALGGATATARALRELGADRVNRSVVQNWRTRGIAWRYRPAVADLLRKARHAVPADFLAPHENKDAA